MAAILNAWSPRTPPPRAHLKAITSASTTFSSTATSSSSQQSLFVAAPPALPGNTHSPCYPPPPPRRPNTRDRVGVRHLAAPSTTSSSVSTKGPFALALSPPHSRQHVLVRRSLSKCRRRRRCPSVCHSRAPSLPPPARRPMPQPADVESGARKQPWSWWARQK